MTRRVYGEWVRAAGGLPIVTGALLLSGAHFRAVLAADAGIVAAIRAAEPFARIEPSQMRLRSAADAEASLFSSWRTFGDREAVKLLVEVNGFEARRVARYMRGGGGCASREVPLGGICSPLSPCLSTLAPTLIA